MFRLRYIYTTKRLLFIFGLLLAFNFGSIDTADAQVVVNVRPARPKVIVKRPARAKRGHIWIDGHWKANRAGTGYVWVKGHWARARRGYRYVPGKWVVVKGGHRWKPGVWVRL